MTRLTRLTRHDAAIKVRDVQATLTRLITVVDQKPHGSSAAMYEAHRKQLANGSRHELDHLQRLVAELAEGLQVTHYAAELSGPTDTSAAALAAALPKASGNRARVLKYVRWTCNNFPSRGGATDVELATLTKLSANSVRPRRGELVAQGWIEDSGVRRDHNGRPHIVWSLTEAARQRLQTGDIET
jgi:hypothetical protein